VLNVIRIHLISLSYHILVFFQPCHFSFMEQMLMLMLTQAIHHSNMPLTHEELVRKYSKVPNEMVLKTTPNKCITWSPFSDWIMVCETRCCKGRTTVRGITNYTHNVSYLHAFLDKYAFYSPYVSSHQLWRLFTMCTVSFSFILKRNAAQDSVHGQRTARQLTRGV